MVDACAWKSDKDLVPQDQIELLLSLLLEAEKRRWLASISPVSSAEHDELQPDDNVEQNYSLGDAGSVLLRHGRCIDQIHKRFHRFERSHFCPKDTTNNKNPDRLSSQMKVVSNEGSFDLNSSYSPRTSSAESSTTQNAGGNLSHKDPLFELYKNALLCAKYPKLSEAQPASPSTPYSPVLLPSMQQRRFSFSKLPNSSHALSASSDGCVSPEVSLPISSEVLQELVMNVFALNKKRQKYFSETIIPQQVPLAREPQRLLVNELRSQQLVLNRNHHPFYSVQAFMNKNTYGEWVKKEKEKIDFLISSFWHNSYPDVSELPLRSEFHQQYVDLMERLIRFESKNKETHPVHGGVTPTAPLSSPACKLLKEFELRYGIGLLFCKLCYLDYFVKYLENDLWYIQHVTVCLQDVMDHVFKCPEIYVEKEFKMLLSILSNLLEKNKYSLTRVRKIFPENSPKDGVPKLLALFKLSLDSARLLQLEFSEIFSTRQMAEDFACNLPKGPLEDLLASYIKTEIDSRYERLKVIATDNLGRDFSGPQLLLNVILEIRQEVKDYNASYKMAFSSYFDIMELAVIKFYSLLMSDVERLCANPRRTRRCHVVDPKMLLLAFRLSKLDKDPFWAKFIPFSRQIWRQPFQEFALQWLDAIGRFLQTLVPQLTSHDVWREAEVNITGSQYRTRRKRQGRPLPRRPLGAMSASLLSLTPSQHSAFNTVAPSTSAPPKTNTIERMFNTKRGKEPLQSRKYPMGSSPPLRTRSPKRSRYNGRGESSSDEDTPNTKHAARSKSPPKANHVQHVVAQIHYPRAKADSSVRAKLFTQPSHREENTTKVTSLEVNPETNNSKTNSEKQQDVQEGSKMEQSSNSRNASSVEHPSCSEQSQHALKVDDNEEVKPRPTAISCQSANAGEGCMVQPFEIKIQQVMNKSDVSRKSSLDQSKDSTEKVLKPSVAIKSPENDFMQLPVNGIHSENEPCGKRLQESNDNENDTRPKLNRPAESTEKEEGQDSVSDCTLHAQEVVEEVLLGGGFSSERSGHDSGSGTPFENNSSDESDADTLFHTSVSLSISENDAKVEILHTKSNSFPGGYPQEAQGGPDKRKSKPNPVPKPCFVSIAQDVKPVKNEGISIEGQGGSGSGLTCVEPEKHIGCVKGSQWSDDNGQSMISTGPKGFQPRQSASIIIPGARHKLVTRLRDTPSGSVGSTISECDSFGTAVESVYSGNSVESFHTARSKSSSSRSQENSDGQQNSDKEPSVQSGQCTGRDDRDDHSDKTQSAVQDLPKVLPVSSSFVDVICAVNRLAAFACHLCKIFCPDESLQRDEHAPVVDDELRNESLRVKRRLCSKLIEVILSFVKLYSDNVLAMETCGLPEELLTEILDEQVQRHLRLLREAGRLQGCRYNPLATQCCNTRDSSGMFIPPCEGISRTQTNTGQYEPLTHQMGVRISSVAILRSILPWLSEYVTTSVNNPDSMSSTHHRFVSSTESELSHSLSYCEYGPSLDGVTNNSTAEAARLSDPPLKTDELHEPGILNGDTEHLCRLEAAQIKLVTYRINTFFKQVLQHLLDLNLPRYTIEKRLKPAMDFLSCELRRFNSVLYPDLFNKLLTDFWSEVVENFKEESHRLVRKKSSATEHSKLLSQAIAELMKFFHAGGVGLVCEKLATPIDATLKHIQLYTSPTDNLISMYHSLYKQVLTMRHQYRVDELTSSASVSSHQASANAPADFVIQALSRELHTTRKCFSGVQLVEWVKNYVLTCKNGLDNLGVCIGDTETDTGLELGQYLLEHGIIMCVSPPPLFNQQTSVVRRQDRPVLNTPAERGQVFISDRPPDITINNITTRSSSSRTSPASATRSSSRCTAVDDSESQGEADDECEDDDGDFLGSGTDVLNRLYSALSEREATFYNHPQAFYKFISEEDSSRTEIKLTLGINDRFNLPDKLKHILCVLYARKRSDKNARIFLSKLPRGLLNEATGTEDVICYPVFRVCQSL